MCLKYDKPATDKFKQDYKKPPRTSITAYKLYVVHLDTETLHPFFFKGIQPPVFPGVVVSDRQKKEPLIDAGDGVLWSINRGMHVYLQPQYVEYTSTSMHPSYVSICVPVTVFLDDLVAVNKDTTEAVFMKITIKKEDYDEAINKQKERQRQYEYHKAKEGILCA